MRYDITVRAGNTGTVDHETGLEVVLKVKVGASFLALDLTGDELVFVARVAPDRPVVMRRTSANGGIVVTPLEGRVLVPFSVAETRALYAAASEPGSALAYELERRRQSPPTQRTVLAGKLTVLPGVNDD